MDKRCALKAGLTVVIIAALSCFTFAETLTVWTFGAAMTDEMNFAGDAYHEANPHVQVEAVQKSGNQVVYAEQIMVAIAADSAPDLMRIDGADAPEYAVKGLLMDVTDALQGIRFTPGEAAEMTFRNRLWGAPYRAVVRGLFKRTDLLEEVGLDPHVDPRSLEELEQWHWRVTKETTPGNYTRVGLVPWQDNWGPPGWFAVFGGQMVAETDAFMTPTATHPNNVKAFEWIDAWAAKMGRQLNPVKNLSTPGFTSGDCALLIQSTSAVATLVNQNVPFLTGRVPHTAAGVNGTWGGGNSIVIPSNAPHPDEAKKFLRFISAPQMQIARYEAMGAFPSNFDAIQRLASSLPVQYLSLLDQIPEVRPRLPLWTAYYDSHLRPQMRSMVQGNKTPMQALDDVQRAVEPLFREFAAMAK